MDFVVKVVLCDVIYGYCMKFSHLKSHSNVFCGVYKFQIVLMY